MKLLSYKATADMPKGLVDILIRYRLKGPYSHDELMFEPGDDVDHYVPDATLEPIDGKYWCGSSSALDIMPAWSKRRPGKIGGVRWKRIDPKEAKWDILSLDTFDETLSFDKIAAARWFHDNQGMGYDYRLIGNFISFMIGQEFDKVVCSESIATALKFEEAWRYDPVMLFKVLKEMMEILNKRPIC
jgi:hypothetical protein